MKNFPRFILLCLLFTACATPEKTEMPEPIPPGRATVDYNEVQQRLGVEIPEGTGFREQSFDACDLGSALESLPEAIRNCHHVYFAMVKFQLSCRYSEESSSVLTENDLRPVSNQNLSWKVGNQNAGSIRSDAAGNGMIRLISNASVKNSYLRLSTGADFLMMRAGQVSAIVTPPSWCP